MSDSVSLSLPAAAVVAHQIAASASAQPPAPSAETKTHININAPFYISPQITFDPITSIVIVTFRSDGKVREQIPPSQVLERYQSVDETGIPNPFLPQRPDLTIKAGPAPQKKDEPAPTPPPSQPASSGTGTIA
ncbi:MAG: hypothetical protein JO021_25335 [Alphaproteobacteria bacterium]|nr:hypothetical protein [Alphaproteobacteria bacterium]